MTLSLSPAAVCQCFTLVSLCTSIADPNWIYVQNSTDHNGKQLIYGVAFTLHAAQNLTDTGPLGGVDGWGMWLLYALAALCYSAVLFSSSSFLLDFLGAGPSHSRLVASLHVCTAALCLAVLGVCGSCLYVIYQNLQRGRMEGRRGPPWAWGGGLWAGPSALQPYPGESLYIQLLGFLFAIMASGFSLSSPPQSAAPRGYTAVEPGEGDTEPHAAPATREEWGEGLPD